MDIVRDRVEASLGGRLLMKPSVTFAGIAGMESNLVGAGCSWPPDGGLRAGMDLPLFII
jgi:hypothetical protein